MQLAVQELLRYTEEERTKWEQWFRENGEELLRMPVASDRDTSIGKLILCAFGPELRYVQRMKHEQPTDYRSRPSTHVHEVFGFGLESRKAMRDFVEHAEPEEWNRIVPLSLSGRTCRASVRKIVLHTLINEIRLWAQIASVMRERGFIPPADEELLVSCALE